MAAKTLTISRLNKAPQTVGVYQFLDTKGKALYIGKAVNIKARLASHLQNAEHDPKEEAFVKGAQKVKIIPTQSEFEALLLEAKLIRKHRPKFNKVWKDDKSYLYILITKEEYPKVLLARGRDLSPADLPAGEADKKRAFGPFRSKRIAQSLVNEIRRAVPFSTRKRMGRRPCFHSKIGLCSPCPNKTAGLKDKGKKQKLKKQYRQNIRRVRQILKGQTAPVVKELKRKLKSLSDQKRYEEAITMRNRLFRFERLISQTLGMDTDTLPQTDVEESVKSLLKLLKRYFDIGRLNRIEAYDVSNFQGNQATAAMVVLTDGRIDKGRYRKFKVKSSKLRVGDVRMLKEIVKRRFQHDNWPKPDLIVVDGGKPQVKTLLGLLRRLGVKVPVVGIAKAPDRLVLGTGKLPTKRLPADHPGFNLLRLARDESHRFSRKYHLFLRGKELLP